MKPARRVLPALLLTVFAGAVPAAHAAPFSNVVVFGDSLSDAGYFRPFLASLGLPSPLVATLGRFTTNPGPIWTELVAQRYGASGAPSNAGGHHDYCHRRCCSCLLLLRHYRWRLVLRRSTLELILVKQLNTQ